VAVADLPIDARLRGPLLRRLRRDRGLRAKDLAYRLGISPSSVYRVEREYQASRPMTLLVALALGSVTLTDLEDQRDCCS
jgi:transcriptional regulator with XRE-family HTH domain